LKTAREKTEENNEEEGGRLVALFTL